MLIYFVSKTHKSSKQFARWAVKFKKKTLENVLLYRCYVDYFLGLIIGHKTHYYIMLWGYFLSHTDNRNNRFLLYDKNINFKFD